MGRQGGPDRGGVRYRGTAAEGDRHPGGIINISSAQAGDASLQSVISPYLAIDGIEAAGLFTADGLMVVWGGERRLDPEAIAAHAASALSSLKALAAELDSVFPPAINLGLPGRDLILAPLNRELTLALIGREGAVLGLIRGETRSP